MRGKRMDDPSPGSRKRYEQSYGDADPGGWSPRRRYEDLAERSHYSGQRTKQEDRSGFSRGWQGQNETAEEDRWGARHARSDELGEDEADAEGLPPEAGDPARARPKPPGIRPLVRGRRKRAAKKRAASTPKIARSGKKTKIKRTGKTSPKNARKTRGGRVASRRRR